jgi:putative FmdB family regulatory protein
MPRYDFRCHDCTTVFEEERSMAQATAPAACPHCGSEHTYKLLSQVAIVNGASRTVGQPRPASKQSAGCGCGACSCGAH